MAPQEATMDSLTVPDGSADKAGQTSTTSETSYGVHHKEGYCLRWSRLRKTVEVKDQGGAGLVRGSIASSRPSVTANRRSSTATATKHILSSVSGCALPGEVLACMGPSGSGKTSLLNTLSGRSSYQEGIISINGEALTGHVHKMKRFMSKIAYVKQADIFFEHLTVQDQMTYTALLRLPGSMPKEAKHEEVERILGLLRLGKVAESPINMISGGEKKRVNIGTELLTDPKVLLLDEPTSGLDSTSAVSLIKLLQSLAREQNKTVITTIHQPSSQVFRSFDKLLMISEGYVAYFGSPAGSLDYLRTQQLACPDGYNAADHWMDLLVNDSAVQAEREEEQQQQAEGDDESRPFIRQSPRLQLQMAWDNDAVAEQMDAAVEQEDARSVATNDTDGKEHESKGHHDGKYNTSWTTQYAVLMHRCLKGSRSSIFTPLNMIKSVAIGLVAGLIWWRMPYTEQRTSDRASYFFFTMTYWVFDSMFNALMSFPAEKVVLMKERASGSYHLSAYFMAKTTSDAPVRLVLPFFYMITSFWMAGIDDRFVTFVASTGCTLLSVLAGESLGLFVGASIPEMDKAMTVMTVSTLALMLLGGFFVENIPSFVAWARYLSPFKYAFDASLQLVFDRDVPCDGSGALESLCRGSDTGFAPAAGVLEILGVQGSVAFNACMLLVICCVPRYFAYLALRLQKGGERS